MNQSRWNWEKFDWPNFTYNIMPLCELELDYAKNSGISYGLQQALPQKEYKKICLKIIIEEAFNTSLIENVRLNPEELENAILYEFSNNREYIFTGEPRETGIASLLNSLYKEADMPLSKKTICSWHNDLLEGVINIKRGDYRSTRQQMRIVSYKDGKQITHFEAPPSDKVEGEMQSFISWFNKTAPNAIDQLPPLARAGIVHLYFVTIHPFEDGNGRIGRALVEKCLCQHQKVPALSSISSTITKNLRAYYQALNEQNTSNNITEWLVYFANVLIEAQQRTTNRFFVEIQKKKLHEEFRDALNSRNITLLDWFLEKDYSRKSIEISASKYREITETTSSTATRDLSNLVGLGILIRTGSLKATRYKLNMKLLDELTPTLIS